MTRAGCLNAVVALLVVVCGCGPGLQQTGQAGDAGPRATGVTPVPPGATGQKVRRPAVAGLFYPRDAKTLASQVDRYLAKVKPAPVERLRGMVAPHAGYDYSGPVAAVAYKQLEDRDVSTVIVMAPSHYAYFEGASIPAVDAYETPLGMVPLSPRARELVNTPPLVSNPRCEVSRPRWRGQSPKEPPPDGEDTPHTWEHSLEVQLPFLQRMLEDFTIVPMVLGQVEPKKVADALEGVLNEQTVVVASSDLSHSYPYDTACQLDASSIRAICDLDVDWMERVDWLPSESPCGRLPILTLMYLAKKHGWRAKLLDYRNSGDTSGDKTEVVGYAAIAFFEPKEGDTPAEAEAPAARLTPQDGKILLDLASKTVTEVVTHGTLPSVELAQMPEGLTQRRACFVTLTKNGELRGCIGTIFPREPLCRAVVERARSAATEDSRFLPVGKEELDKLDIEVSVLTVPRRLEFKSPEDLVAKLRPNVDGVVLRIGRRQATYLPQVWEQIPEAQAFLSHLSQKAGLPPDAWKSPQAMVLIYQVEAFK